MASSTKLVGTGINYSNAGDWEWSNPSNIVDDDADYAEVVGTSGMADSLVGYNCGFAIPTGATINGILVEMSMLSAGDGEANSACTIRKTDASYGETTVEPSSYAIPTGSYGTISWGSATELWGLTWTPADINDADFGARLLTVSIEAETEGWVRVQYMKITVYYTIPVTALNIGAAWKDIDFAGSKLNVGDAWKAIVAVAINIGDVWKVVYGTLAGTPAILLEDGFYLLQETNDKILQE